MPIRLVLIDDRELFRDALEATLSRREQFEVVGTASEAAGAANMVRALAPDAVLLGLQVPNAPALVRELVSAEPSAKVLVITVGEDRSLVREAFVAGARGCVPMRQSFDSVVDAITQVASGQTYLSPLLAAPVRFTKPAPGGDFTHKLSPRERAVFDLILRALSNQQIAQELRISIKTVETHRASINRKLGVHSGTQLMRLAAASGMLGT